MSNVKISEMPSATSVSGSDLIPIVQGGVSKKASVSQLADNDFIQIRNTSDYSKSVSGNWNKYFIPLTTIYNSKGTSLTLNSTDGTVVIGSDISRVKVSLNFAIAGATSETAPAIHIKHSGETNWTAVYPAGNFTAYNSSVWVTACLQTIIDVNQGDELMLGFNTHTSGTLKFNGIGTVLTVEKIV